MKLFCFHEHEHEHEQFLPPNHHHLSGLVNLTPTPTQVDTITTTYDFDMVAVYCISFEDNQHVMAAFLTFSMLVMLGNMIRREHFDTDIVTVSTVSTVEYDVGKASSQMQSLVKHLGVSKGPWKQDTEFLKPCWNKTSLKGRVQQSKGSIIFSLSGGPEYHVLQIADAVVVTRYLGATLILPDIIGDKAGDKRNFEEVYDVKKFVTSLDGIVNVEDQAPNISTGKLANVRVPHKVSETYITAHIKPLFQRTGKLRLEIYFNSSTTSNAEETKFINSYSCLAMFETLQLKQELRQVVDSMVTKLRTSTKKSNGRFIAVDLLGKECQENGNTGTKGFHNALEIGQFLKKIDFHTDTVIYLTQCRWHSSVDALRNIYPNTFTKEDVLPAYIKAKFLNSKSCDFARIIDFYLCSESEVFIPAYFSLFYTNVVGKRITSGKTQVFVSAQTNSTSAADYISPYISKKNHMAYSCLC